MFFLFKNRTVVASAAVAVLACLPWASAQAAVATTTFSVTATVNATCLINSASNINFGAYNNAVLTATGTIQLTCSNTVPFNIGLNAGVSSGATVTTRKMTGPGPDLLNYGLFQDAAFATNWGNTIGTDTVPGTGTGVVQSFTVFGQLPAGQFVGPGTYNDTITATLTF